MIDRPFGLTIPSSKLIQFQENTFEKGTGNYSQDKMVV